MASQSFRNVDFSSISEALGKYKKLVVDTWVSKKYKIHYYLLKHSQMSDFALFITILQVPTYLPFFLQLIQYNF